MCATRLFRIYGELCAAHPWEIIVATLTLTVCMVTVEHQQPALPVKPPARNCTGCLNEAEYNAADVIIMTLIRCLAVLYSYYQLRTLRKMGSKYILGIAGLFTVFSSFIFTSAGVKFLQIDLPDFKDTLFFFLLLIDLSKAGKLTQFALSGSNLEVQDNIARGMSLLGPTITLDTIVETLVIGVGTLSGVHRLEVLSYIALLSVMVNYIIFMTFYPACLSLILELSRSNFCGTDAMRRYFKSATLMEDDKSNPVVQRVKLIMSAGLIIVHTLSRWPFRKSEIDVTGPFEVEQLSNLNQTEEVVLHNHIMRWIVLSTDHIVVLTLLLALIAKLVLFDNEDEIEGELHAQTLQEHINRTFINDNSLKQGNESVESEDKEIQTDLLVSDRSKEIELKRIFSDDLRSLEECLKVYEKQLKASELNDEEVMLLVKNKHIPLHQLEKAVDDPERGVKIRREVVGKLGNFTAAFHSLPYKNYDYSKVMGACCENVVGYIPVPVGIIGPLLLDGRLIYVPMATTEGCLVASTNRGSRALLNCGITSRIVADGMTRGPVVRFPSLSDASKAMAWIDTSENFLAIKESFDGTSRFAQLTRIHVRIAGRYLFIRFVARSGDAMGMNMLSKGTEVSLKLIKSHFTNMEILSLSGNFCTDKKPAAINWIEGRGKSVACEAIVPSQIVKSVLKTSVHALVDVNISKNMIGSAIAGSIGGFNAHAANIVTALFIATGQDPAQNVVSSNCMTLMEPWGEHGEDLYISCTMPSIEIGTVGGGTVLPPQASCLDILGVKGPNRTSPGENANRLARIVCGTVLAGELSLMAALTAGHLVESHLKHNRSLVCLSSTTSTSQDS